ncbi:hypothetical protein BUALT_Bualt01G0056300 [Buddleja alternifolia]|uniref:Uncharacterized protein n=1 Tax=Buddleja alternifolia TaxID=168488 RepID=A0AAV6YAR0_9LAMI|nr:hypothetical protein BUALT_Bualt01G0056300 [Buddleja alternifolia]
MDSENGVQRRSLAEPRSETKVLKRGVIEAEETSESAHKRVKLRDFESILRSKGKKFVHFILSDLGRGESIKLDLNAHVMEFEKSNKLVKAKKIDLDLNAEHISSSINTNSFRPNKNYEYLKSKDDSDCGSSVNDEKDLMRVWKSLKQNNYLSTHCGAVPMPKTRSRKKNNNDVMKKKKMELARKEQVDRFAKVAAPSGLLNGLNPGIINHVRNSKQVHSIIEALVKSERSESRDHGRKNDIFVEQNRIGDYASFGESVCLKSEVISGDGDSYTGDTRIFSRMPSPCNIDEKDDPLGLQMENTSCLSNEESANLTSVNSLSVKAANVASQWLELLNQDIKGRLAALRRSKKRVRAVITTELPLLISREFSSDKASADAHFVRWSNIFEQMDKALYEEESHLESWLNQVKEMQLHCERGLCKSSLYHTAPIGNDNRLGEANNLEKDLAVRAAAASIYSTCNFVLSMENLPFC